MDATKLITLGAVAVGGYFLYENFFATAALPSDAAFLQQIPVGTVVAIPSSAAALTTMESGATATTALGYLYYSPSLKLYYASFTAPTATQLASQGMPVTGPAVPAASATGSTATTTTSPAATTTAAAAPTNYAAMCTATRTAVQQSGDPNFTASGGDYLGTPYQWQFYWNLQPGAPNLNINGMFSNTSAQTSGAQFCAAVSTYLAAQGLAGYLAGMGFYGMGTDTPDSSDVNQAAADFIGSISTIDPLQGATTNDYSTSGTGLLLANTPATVATTSNYTPVYIALAAAVGVIMLAGGHR